MQLISQVRETATPLTTANVAGRENFLSQHFCGSRAKSCSALKMSDGVSDHWSDRRPRLCPGGFLSKPPSENLFIWILYTVVSLAVNLSLIILGALINDPEKCRVVKVPQFMMISGSIGLVLTLMSIAVLWQNISGWTVLLYQILITVPSYIYASIAIKNLSSDKSSPDYCDSSVSVFAYVSFYIAPLSLLLMLLIKIIYDRCC